MIPRNKTRNWKLKRNICRKSSINLWQMFSLCEMLLKAWPFRFLKTTEQYFLLFLFIMLNKVVLMLISLDEFSNVLLYKVLFIMYTHESSLWEAPYSFKSIVPILFSFSIHDCFQLSYQVLETLSKMYFDSLKRNMGHMFVSNFSHC